MISVTKRLLSKGKNAWAITCLLVFAFAVTAYSQSTLTSKFQYVQNPPADLLATRSVVFFDPAFTKPELEEIQKAFQQIGIDAVLYFATDLVFAGKDIVKSFSEYLAARQIKYIIVFTKSGQGFQFYTTLFEPKSGIFDPGQSAWRVTQDRLSDLLRTIFQDSWRSQKKQNYLVNEFPETDITVNPFRGNRQEFYAIDLKVDKLAVPKFGNEAIDKELEQFFQTNYPLKYKIFDAGTEEVEMRRQGYQYVLCYVHTRGMVAKEILGYDMTKAESAYASITFPDGQLQLKTLPEQTEIYKFYFRHIDNGNVFLGTKWDADVTWSDALRNYIFGFKIEAKLN